MQNFLNWFSCSELFEAVSSCWQELGLNCHGIVSGATWVPMFFKIDLCTFSISVSSKHNIYPCHTYPPPPILFYPFTMAAVCGSSITAYPTSFQAYSMCVGFHPKWSKVLVRAQTEPKQDAYYGHENTACLCTHFIMHLIVGDESSHFKFKTSLLHCTHPSPDEPPLICDIHSSHTPPLSEDLSSHHLWLIWSMSLYWCIHDHVKGALWWQILQ